VAYDEALDRRVAEIAEVWGATRRRMFGGTGYMLCGNMLCGVLDDALILRLGVAAAEEALRRAHVRDFDVTGRPMRGWVMIDPPGYSDEMLGEWLEKAREFARTLPPK